MPRLVNRLLDCLALFFAVRGSRTQRTTIHHRSIGRGSLVRSRLFKIDDQSSEGIGATTSFEFEMNLWSRSPPLAHKFFVCCVKDIAWLGDSTDLSP